MADRTCAIAHCARPPIARGYCDTHYAMWWKAGGHAETNRRWSKAYAWCAEVAAQPEWPSHCIIFPFKTSQGRPLASDGPRGKVLAYRLVCELAGRPISQHLQARHTCDTPLCCNPRHLIEGTNDDNIADKVARGRQARGEKSGHSRLTERAVREIRASAESPTALAARHGVARQTINDVLWGRTWKHVS